MSPAAAAPASQRPQPSCPAVPSAQCSELTEKCLNWGGTSRGPVSTVAMWRARLSGDGEPEPQRRRAIADSVPRSCVWLAHLARLGQARGRCFLNPYIGYVLARLSSDDTCGRHGDHDTGAPLQAPPLLTWRQSVSKLNPSAMSVGCSPRRMSLLSWAVTLNCWRSSSRAAAVIDPLRAVTLARSLIVGRHRRQQQSAQGLSCSSGSTACSQDFPRTNGENQTCDMHVSVPNTTPLGPRAATPADSHAWRPTRVECCPAARRSASFSRDGSD